MNLDSIFGLHEQALFVRGQKTQVLASNLANADTPGYKAKDIDFREALENVSSKSERMVTTNPLHMSDNEDLLDMSLKYRVPMQTRLDGNTVDTQVENGKFAENSMRYIATLRFMDAKIKSAVAAVRGE